MLQRPARQVEAAFHWAAPWPAPATAGGAAGAMGSSPRILTFCPGFSRWAPAVTTVWPGVSAARQQDVVAARPRHLHRRQPDRAVVDYPDRRVVLVAQQGRQRQLDHLVRRTGDEGDVAGHAELDRIRRLRQRNFDRIGASGGIGDRRHFADLAGDGLLRIGPQAHSYIVYMPQGVDLVFRHADHDFRLARLRHPHHRRAGRHHLAGFGVDPGDHAIDIGHQRWCSRSG